MYSWILASASPRRKRILEDIGLSFEVAVPDVDEATDVYMHPKKLAGHLAVKKCLFAAETHKTSVVIAADTVVSVKNNVLGKPKNKEDAAKMLKILSGKIHRVYTGIAVSYKGKTVFDVVCTAVRFKDLSDEDINLYIESGEPYDKAGGYGIQGKGALLVKEIKGDYFNVVGLPVSKLHHLLYEKFDINLLAKAAIE